jgi:hypothetical protein
MKVGDLVRMRSGKIVLILEEQIDKKGNKRFITLIDGEKRNQPASLLNVFGKVISENIAH